MSHLLTVCTFALALIVVKCHSGSVKSSLLPVSTNSAINVTLQINQTEVGKCEATKVFHKETQACYTSASFTLTPPDKKNSPCGELMYFYESPSGYGVCDCINEDNCRFYVDFHRPILNWPKSNRCYFDYDQGPCKPGQWLIMNKKTLHSECAPNPCVGKAIEKISPELQFSYSMENIDIFHFQKNGTCYQTFTQAYCKPDEYVRFLRTYPVPFCSQKPGYFGCGSAGTTATLPSPQGHKRVGDECSPFADFQ